MAGYQGGARRWSARQYLLQLVVALGGCSCASTEGQNPLGPVPVVDASPSESGLDAGVPRDAAPERPLADAMVVAVALDAAPPAPVDPLAVPAGCPLVRPAAVNGRPWAIAAVSFSLAEVIFQNVSGVDQELTSNFYWCLPAVYERLIPLDLNADPPATVFRTVAPGEIVRVPLTSSEDRNTRIFVDPTGGEMGLYPTSGLFNDADSILAYVSWGEGQPLGLISRDTVAAAAGIWTFNDHVAVAPGHAGIVAVGPGDTSEGYVSIPASCYPRETAPAEQTP